MACMQHVVLCLAVTSFLHVTTGAPHSSCVQLQNSCVKPFVEQLVSQVYDVFLVKAVSSSFDASTTCTNISPLLTCTKNAMQSGCDVSTNARVKTEFAEHLCSKSGKALLTNMMESECFDNQPKQKKLADHIAFICYGARWVKEIKDAAKNPELCKVFDEIEECVSFYAKRVCGQHYMEFYSRGVNLSLRHQRMRHDCLK